MIIEINDGDTGLVVRDALNDMFAEIYGWTYNRIESIDTLNSLDFEAVGEEGNAFLTLDTGKLFKINDGSVTNFQIGPNGNFFTNGIVVKDLELDEYLIIHEDKTIEFRNQSGTFSEISVTTESTSHDSGLKLISRTGSIGKTELNWKWNGSLLANSTEILPLDIKTSIVVQEVGKWAINATETSATVTSSGFFTDRNMGLVSGDVIQINEVNYTILSVDNANQITLTVPYAESSNSNPIRLPRKNLISGNKLGNVGIGTVDQTEKLHVAGNCKATNLILDVNTTDVDNPPTDAQLDSLYGTPAEVGAGFTSYIDDNGAGANFYQIVSDGTNWWVFTGVQA